MILPENNDQDLDNTNDQNENDEHKKTVYNDSEETSSDDEASNGDSSSVSDIGRSDFIHTPRRSNKPLGSGHEPGTMPGSNNL
jgi:hypothetical protein